jgi:uncharacterized peroxidase-related enzyme
MAAVNPIPKEKADPELGGIYDKMIRKLGIMPNFYAVMAQRPAVLKNFLAFYASIINEGSLEQKYKELAYLKTAIVNGCQYCTRAHTSSAKGIGITEEQIQALTFYKNSELFDEKEKAVILYAERVTRGAAGIREGSLQELKRYFTEEQVVELTLTICVANFTNRFNDALQIEPDLG